MVRTVIALGAAAALALPATAVADLTAPETVNLNTYEASADGAAGPVSTTESLTAGQSYVAEVTGTFSVWHRSLWTGEAPAYHVCGNAEDAPIFPTPGRPATPAGQDALFVFARPLQSECTGTYPYAYPAFEIDTGSGFSHRTPLNEGAGPNAQHRYRFALTGEGAPASFRHLDTETRDNNGVLQIVVSPAASGREPSQEPEVLPPARQCLSRRRFMIRIRTYRRDPTVAAAVVVRGRRVPVTRRTVGGRRRLTAIVDLRGVPRRRVRIYISARLKSGRIVTGSREYQTCWPRRRGGVPKL